jgi:hypothetical protein
LHATDVSAKRAAAVAARIFFMSNSWFLVGADGGPRTGAGGRYDV